MQTHRHMHAYIWCWSAGYGHLSLPASPQPLILTTISVADLREASLLVLLLLPPMYDGRGLFIPRDWSWAKSRHAALVSPWLGESWERLSTSTSVASSVLFFPLRQSPLVSPACTDLFQQKKSTSWRHLFVFSSVGCKRGNSETYILSKSYCRRTLYRIGFLVLIFPLNKKNDQVYKSLFWVASHYWGNCLWVVTLRENDFLRVALHVRSTKGLPQTLPLGKLFRFFFFF